MHSLETPRLMLREMRPADVESLHQLVSDPLLMRFWPVFTLAETEEWIGARDAMIFAQVNLDRGRQQILDRDRAGHAST